MDIKLVISATICLALASAGCASTLSQVSDTRPPGRPSACAEPMEESLGLPVPTGNPIAYEHEMTAPESCPRKTEVAGR